MSKNGTIAFVIIAIVLAGIISFIFYKKNKANMAAALSNNALPPAQAIGLVQPGPLLIPSGTKVQQDPTKVNMTASAPSH